MKFDALKPRAKSDGWKADPARAAREKKSFIERATWPHEIGVRRHKLSDDEIVGMLDQYRDYAAAGIVEKIFGKQVIQRFGWQVIRNGWSVVPQSRGFNETPGDVDDDERYPASTPFLLKSGKMGRQPFLPTAWRTRRPNLREYLEWEWYLGVNLAIQCCEASMHIRGLDIDCRNPIVAAKVYDLAVKHLGVSPFIRVGAAPKMMLLYRVEGDDIEIGKFTITILNPDGTPDVGEDGKPQNAVEFLGNGALITYYGLHHKTGRTFEVSGGSLHPAIAGPEHAPIVTLEQLRAFENELAEYRPVIGTVSNSNPYGGRNTTIEFEKVDDRLWTPKVSMGDWQTNDDGYIIKGAENWLTSQTWAICGANANNFEEMLPSIEAWLTRHAIEKLSKTNRSKKAYGSAEAIARSVRSKLRPTVAKWRQSLDSKLRGGDYLHHAIPYRILSDGRRPTAQRIVPSPRPCDGSLDWIPNETSSIEALAVYKSRTPVSLVPKTGESIATDKLFRGLIDDLYERQRVTASISDRVGEAMTDVLAKSAVILAEGEKALLHIIRAPTGAGKTTTTIDKVAEYCKANPRREGEGPILLVVPTHANGEEALAKAEASGEYNGDMWSLSDILSAIARGEKMGVRIMRFIGREASGCQMIEQMNVLSRQGIRGSGLCETRIDSVPEIEAAAMRHSGQKVPRETVLCEYRERGECAYYHQHDQLLTAEVVILTHAYVTQNGLPKELKNPRLVIADESLTYQLLQQARIPLGVLDISRSRPVPTKADRARYPGVDSTEVSYRIEHGRLEACRRAKEALLSGKDVAAHFFKLHGEAAMEYVEEAIIVCERSHDADKLVMPNLSTEQVTAIAKTAVAEYLMEEIRFWRIVSDRLQMLINDARALVGPLPAKKTAHGPRDMRIQVLQLPHAKTGNTEPHIRMSWRRQPNWQDRPMILLDASANKRIVEKCFGRQATVTDITAPLHVRTVAMIEKTWSTASFVPPTDASETELATAAANIAEARQLITVTALQYGHGRVLVGSTMAVRQVIAGDAWTPPPNVDFVHFGALRGLDFAKHHVAAISIGRSEQPIQIVDGYVAALTYDDFEPELPYDLLGTGLTEAGKPLFRRPAERVMTMRSGQDWSHWVPEMPGTGRIGEDGKEIASWSQDLEQSWREEELRQFVGRLRPVYRGVMLDDAGTPVDVEPPVWIAVGKVQPAGLVIDEIVEMKQLVKPAPFFELARLGGGILDYAVLGNGPEIEAARATLPKSESYQLRTMSAMWLVEYVIGANKRVAMVSPAWLDARDAGDYWLEKAAAVGVSDARVLKVTPPSRTVTGVGVKKADKLDLQQSSREDRASAELTVRAIADRANLPAVDVELRLLAGQRVAGIALNDEEPEYVPEIEERYIVNQILRTHEDYWGGHGSTVGGVEIEDIESVV